MRKHLYLGRYHKTKITHPWFSSTPHADTSSARSAFCCATEDLEEMWLAVKKRCRIWMVFDGGGPYWVDMEVGGLGFGRLRQSYETASKPEMFSRSHMDFSQIGFLRRIGYQGERFYLEWEEA